MKKDDNQYSSVEFNSTTRGALQKKETVNKVVGIVYSKSGVPRLKLSNHFYISAKKNIVGKK
ncbi:hypothetical protein BTEBP_40158 [Brochothrix thermosphacta]|nr:hypothetical protein BTEBP_40158 [Brochothrix thermosphacta]